MSALPLSASAPLVIVPVMAPTGSELTPALQRAITAGAPAIEWRADALCQDLDTTGWLDALQAAGQQIDALWSAAAQPPPLILTVRTEDEGGLRSLPAEEYAQAIRILSGIRAAAAVDIEAVRAGSDAPALVADARAGLPARERTVIASFHDWARTPELRECMELLSGLAESGADVLKLAVTPQREEDVLTLLTATLQRSRSSEQSLITISMGERGMISRIGGHVMGSCATFASLEKPSAPGQLSLEQMRAVLALLT